MSTSTVGERLRDLRLSARLSQAALGKRVGISGPTISNYETGYSRLVADELPKFAAALGCSPCDFFEPDERERSRRMSALIREEFGGQPAPPNASRPTLGQELAADLLAALKDVPPEQITVLLEFLEWQSERVRSTE